MTENPAQSLSQRLKAETRVVHERIDASVMEQASFATIEGYGRFLRMQWRFHRDIDPLYCDPALVALLPDVPGRRRLELIAADLNDLGLFLPKDEEPASPLSGDVPTALGWLYVAEGSNLGAALLRKEAAKLGLSDEHGARHLAPAKEGPAAHWRAFTTALDAVDFDADAQALAIMGASQAFARVQAYAATDLA